MTDNDRSMELIKKIVKMEHLIRRGQVTAGVKGHAQMDATRGQGRVLTVLDRAGTMTSRDLAYILQIRQQSLNELIGKLENAGYVSRKADETDRRSILISITDEGKTALGQFGSRSTDLFDCLDENELDTFDSCMDKLIGKLEADLPEDNAPEFVEGMRERMGDARFGAAMDFRGNRPDMPPRHDEPINRGHMPDGRCGGEERDFLRAMRRPENPEDEGRMRREHCGEHGHHGRGDGCGHGPGMRMEREGHFGDRPAERRDEGCRRHPERPDDRHKDGPSGGGCSHEGHGHGYGRF